jgi:hypothetical protein
MTDIDLVGGGAGRHSVAVVGVGTVVLRVKLSLSKDI